MAAKHKAAVLILLVFLTLIHNSVLKLRVSSLLGSISKRVASTNFDAVNVGQVGPKYGEFAIGGGLIAYRSSVISSLTQLDRGEDEAATESLRIAIASLTLETTKTYGLPIVSVVIDKIVNKYGTRFPKTVTGFRTYRQMLGDAIINQATNVAAPQMIENADEVLDSLDTLKARMRTDFGEEVTSFLKSSTAHDDLVKPLQNAKTWAKVAKWSDFLLGPVFDVANIAFTGWQLHNAIQAGDDLAIASGSLCIVSSVVGVGAFIAGGLATAGGVIAATAGPIGAIIGCILSLAALIIDIINLYNPNQKINEHLKLVRSLTTASKEMLTDLHLKVLEKATASEVEAGFNTFFEVNQAMLVKASIQDQWDTIKGFNSEPHERITFKPETVKEEGDLLVVGDMRVFDKKHYQNWAFKPKGTEEIGYNYYGKRIRDEEGGVSVRVDTEMVTNAETNMWFWLNGARVTTYAEGEEDREVDDNVQIGDFRTLLPTSDRFIEVETGGGNDLLQLTAVICADQQQKHLHGRCLVASMGDGYDTVSFEGMDTRREERKWFMRNDDLEETKLVVGIIFDMPIGWISYRLRDDRGQVSDVRFGGVDSAERFIGSPLHDIVKFDDSKNFVIKESSGDNLYELSIDANGHGKQYVIEDNSDTPGKLVIRKNGLGWSNVLFSERTNIILIMLGRDNTAEVFIKRAKPGLRDFRVRVNSGSTKKISDMTIVGASTDVVFPFVPYSYKFDTNLITRFDQETYIEFLLPTAPYPAKTETYSFKLVYASSRFMLGNDLLNELSNNAYTLTAHRRGSRQSSNSWKLLLRNRGGSGGWRVNVGQNGIFVTGTPGNFREICNLALQDRNEVDIFNEYRTIMQNVKFDSSENYYGTDNPDKVTFIVPWGFQDREQVGTYVIDLKGPARPTATARNELVMDDSLIGDFFKHDLTRYIKLELKRASLEEDWHLKVYSNWGEKILRIDITLKGVHAIITGPKYVWKLVLDLHGSRELSHDLNSELYWAVGKDL